MTPDRMPEHEGTYSGGLGTQAANHAPMAVQEQAWLARFAAGLLLKKSPASSILLLE